MGHVVIVGDTGGYVRAFDKATGEPIGFGGYPLHLSDEPYRSGDQQEKWYEPIGGTATQMTVAAGMMLVGVNSQTEERTVLKAYRLHRLPDLTLRYLDVPAAASQNGFPIQVQAVCRGCDEPITTTVSLSLNGLELRRQTVTFRAAGGWADTLNWPSSGPVPTGQVEVVATADPDDLVEEADETNNSLRATVEIPTVSPGGEDDDGLGSKLTH